ncbi:unnamed protein product [Gadus morhua 'NCC']
MTPAEDRIVGLLSKADYEGIDGGFETGLPVDFLETTTSVSEVVEVDATQPPPEKKTRPLKSSPETLALLEIEREKLQLYRERVAIERERLLLERETFEWEKSMCGGPTLSNQPTEPPSSELKRTETYTLAVTEVPKEKDKGFSDDTNATKVSPRAGFHGAQNQPGAYDPQGVRGLTSHQLRRWTATTTTTTTTIYHQHHPPPSTIHYHPAPSTTQHHPPPSPIHHPAPSTTRHHPLPPSTIHHPAPSTTQPHPPPSTIHHPAPSTTTQHHPPPSTIHYHPAP